MRIGALLVAEDLIGRESHFGPLQVTADMVAAYARAAGEDAFEGESGEVPALFCLTLRRDMMPDVPLPHELFGVYGGHDLELLQPIRVGGVYHSTARIVDVYAKSGRSGLLTVVVREVVIRDGNDTVVARIIERQIVRRKQ